MLLSGQRTYELVHTYVAGWLWSIYTDHNIVLYPGLWLSFWLFPLHAYPQHRGVFVNSEHKTLIVLDLTLPTCKQEVMNIGPHSQATRIPHMIIMNPAMSVCKQQEMINYLTLSYPKVWVRPSLLLVTTTALLFPFTSIHVRFSCDPCQTVSFDSSDTCLRACAFHILTWTCGNILHGHDRACSWLGRRDQEWITCFSLSLAGLIRTKTLIPSESSFGAIVVYTYSRFLPWRDGGIVTFC